MLSIPNEANPTMRFVGIDPGSTKLGICVLDVNLSTKEIFVKAAQTFHADKLTRVIPHEDYLLHGDRQSRLLMLSNELLWFLRYWRPHLISSESPFMGLGVTAFETLVECVAMIRYTALEYNPDIPLLLVSPTAAKRTVGVKAKGSGKDDVRQGVLQIPNLHFLNGICIDNLDEHAVDAIAIAYNRCVELYFLN